MYCTNKYVYPAYPEAHYRIYMETRKNGHVTEKMIGNPFGYKTHIEAVADILKEYGDYRNFKYDGRMDQYWLDLGYGDRVEFNIENELKKYEMES